MVRAIRRALKGFNLLQDWKIIVEKKKIGGGEILLKERYIDVLALIVLNYLVYARFKFWNFSMYCLIFC